MPMSCAETIGLREVNGRLHVDHAPPQALISDMSLSCMADGNHHRDISFTAGPAGGLAGAVVRISAANGRWVYEVQHLVRDGKPRIGGTHWLARWPD